MSAKETDAGHYHEPERKSIRLPPLPKDIVSKASFDPESRILYVDNEILGNVHLLNWKHRCELEFKDVKIEIQGADLDVIAHLQATRRSEADKEKNKDLMVREDAIHILTMAARYRASDVHYLLKGKRAEIQLSIDKKLYVLKIINQELAEAIVRATFGLAVSSGSSFKTNEFQNALIPGSIIPDEFKLNVSSMRLIRGPSHATQGDGGNGQFMTIRLQYSQSHNRSTTDATNRNNMPALKHPRRPGERITTDAAAKNEDIGHVLQIEKRGYTEKQKEKMQMMIDTPRGIIVATGPTDSGKSTLIDDLLTDTAWLKPYKRQVTIEDPVELPKPWAVQMSIGNARNDEETSRAYAERARALLRMAPQIILLGELRDAEVAITAAKMAETGHQVLTTLHVTNPFMFFLRMEQMDREDLNRRIFCENKDVLTGVISQSLLPELCSCSLLLADMPHKLSRRATEALRTWGPIDKVRVENPAGCPKCGHRGSIGRVAVAEVVVFDEEIRSDVLEYGPEAAYERYLKRKDADVPMQENAILRALDGKVDPNAIQDNVARIDPKSRVN